MSVYYYAHTVELDNSLEKARGRGAAIQQILGSAQKLEYAKWETL